jgi:Fe2+ or Zn2+ uptake regulation protein
MAIITFEEAAERFHNAGMRMTKARESLLRLVLESSDPFSVKTLHERADNAGLDMHLATVHRNLAEFVEVGIVDKLPSEDNNLFSLHVENESGAHVFCLDCRNLVPLAGTTFNNGEQMNALTEALMQRGFDTSTVRLMLAAHCKTQSCAKNDGDN